MNYDMRHVQFFIRQLLRCHRHVVLTKTNFEYRTHISTGQTIKNNNNNNKKKREIVIPEKLPGTKLIKS